MVWPKGKLEDVVTVVVGVTWVGGGLGAEKRGVELEAEKRGPGVAVSGLVKVDEKGVVVEAPKMVGGAVVVVVCSFEEVAGKADGAELKAELREN